MLDWDRDALMGLAGRALELKRGAHTDTLRDKILAMVYFNPSLRTRASFEAAMARFGGHAITLSVGGDMWSLEFRDGAVMDGKAAEHIKEAAPVLSRYADALGVRCFAGMQSVAEDANDETIKAFGKHATVPVVNLESAVEHPCQSLADMATMVERLGNPRGKRFVLTWAPQVNATPMAVPHSAVLAAKNLGMEVIIARPDGYGLLPTYADGADTTTDQVSACKTADVVYVKSWGSAQFYGDIEAQKADFVKLADWLVTPAHLGENSILLHCLPVRRNVVVADAVLDGPHSVVVDQAENRMWAQAAILEELWR